MKQQQISFEQEAYEIYLAKFVISTDKLNALLSPDQISKLYRMLKDNLHQSDAFLNSFILKQIYPAIEQFRGQQFKASPKKFPAYFPKRLEQTSITIIDRLVDVKLSYLQILNLSHQSLFSIQSLAFLNAPKLRCLELHNNYIRNLESLNKSNFPKLQILTFYNNPIKIIDNLPRIRTKSIYKYQFDYSQNIYPDRVQDYRFLFKTECLKPRKINVSDQGRMNITSNKLFLKLNQPQSQIIVYIPPDQMLWDYEDDIVLD